MYVSNAIFIEQKFDYILISTVNLKERDTICQFMEEIYTGIR